jgi:hypothetical protein
MAITGFVLIYLGALSTTLALFTGTCTGGAADQLFGGLYSLALYLFGWAFLYFSKLRALWLAILLPVAPIAWWQLDFAIRLGYGFFFANLGACTVLGHGDWTDGTPEGWFDGRESTFFLVWSAVNLAFLLGAVAAFSKARTITSS